MLAHAVETSNHEFVTGMTLLGALPPLMNGARAYMFPGSATPMNLAIVLVNYPQSRKSQMTGLVKKIGDELDRYVYIVVSDSQKAGAEDPTAIGNATKANVSSSVLSSFTPEAFFERVSGDYAQVRNADEAGIPGVAHLGRLANIDEV